MATVHVAYKRKGAGRLRWIECSADCPRDAYNKLQQSCQVRELLSEGYREYGIIGL